MESEYEGEMKRNMNRCSECEMYTAVSKTYGSCEFGRRMDVRPIWMQGERIPVHPVKHDGGETCEAFIPHSSDAGIRNQWLFDNLTSKN
jgi:hypothetical protein